MQWSQLLGVWKASPEQVLSHVVNLNFLNSGQKGQQGLAEGLRTIGLKSPKLFRSPSRLSCEACWPSGLQLSTCREASSAPLHVLPRGLPGSSASSKAAPYSPVSSLYSPSGQSTHSKQQVGSPSIMPFLVPGRQSLLQLENGTCKKRARGGLMVAMPFQP